MLRVVQIGILFGVMVLLIIAALADILPDDVAAMFVAILAFGAVGLGLLGRRRG